MCVILANNCHPDKSNHKKLKTKRGKLLRPGKKGRTKQVGEHGKGEPSFEELSLCPNKVLILLAPRDSVT